MRAAAAQNASCPRDRRLALRRTRDALDRRLSSSAACRVPEVISFRGEGSSCYFVISCTAYGSIDEIVCPCAAFSGLGKSMPFLTWCFETATVGSRSLSMLSRKNCQKACANERNSMDMGSEEGEVLCPGGGSWSTARARMLACMQRNSGHSIVSKKNRYRTLKRRLFV